MQLTDRARHIIDQVVAMDARWGKPGDPRKNGSDKPSRIISDDPSWYARLTYEDQVGPDGEVWNLVEIFAYEERRMTAAFLGDQIHVRDYKSGVWEKLFNLINLPVLAAHRPNKGTEWEM